MVFRLQTVNRWHAASIHAGISLTVASAVAALVFLVWFPPELLVVTGGVSLFVVLIAVDVALGPSLTLIVFNPAKKWLKFDLLVIAGLQLAALCYGLYVVSEARPVYVVFAVDRFEAVTAAEIPLQELAKVSDARFAKLPWFGPRYVAAVTPLDGQERKRILFAGLQGVDIQQFPQYFIPYADQAGNAAARARRIEDLIRDKPHAEPAVAKFLGRSGIAAAAAAYLPLHARNRDATLVLRKDSGEILGVVPIDPW
jgi:hypothetical protein